jgi:hypothetical protein
MFDFIKDINNYEDRKLEKTEVNGVTVSTAYTSDEGYETALIDANGVHPVERYPSKEHAHHGHEKWCKKAETVKEVIKLGGFGGFIKDEVITIVRSKGI